MFPKLTPENASIFRIEHVDNLAWNIEQNSLFCRNSVEDNPNFVNIGNPDLIDKRANRDVPIAPGATLSDYVPFYFTPSSVMLLDIITGKNVPRRRKDEIVIFVSSLHKLNELQLPYVFTDRHAYANDARFFSDIAMLDQVDWEILQSRDFRGEDSYLNKQSHYQAEALVYQSVSLSAMLGICCVNNLVKQRIENDLGNFGSGIPVVERPEYYFPL